MHSSTTKLNGEYRRDYTWMDCVLHVNDSESIDFKKLSVLLDEFSTLTIASPDTRPEGLLQSSVVWHKYDAQEYGKAEIWNHLLACAKSEWVLFLENGDEIRFYRLPEKGDLDPETWVPACIQRKDEKSIRNFYQIRIVHSGADAPFAGKNLPDCTDYIMQNNIRLLDQPVVLDRKTDGLVTIDPAEEMSVKKISPKVYLLEGERLMDERKYVHAAAQYRKVLKTERLLPFDRLGAVNGLSRCYTEQYKWPKAMQLVKNSIEAEPVQRLPYLIQFRIHQLNKQWAEAYTCLKDYQSQLGITSRSTFDIAISEDETLVTLSELAMKAGFKKEAFELFEEIYSGKKGEADKGLLRNLMMLSLELENRERAIVYFEEIFKEKFPANLTEKQVAELNDYMTLFMNNGWYVYAAEIYDELYSCFSNNAEYRRRLIVALSKTNRIEKARKLIAS